MTAVTGQVFSTFLATQ